MLIRRMLIMAGYGNNSDDNDNDRDDDKHEEDGRMFVMEDD